MHEIYTKDSLIKRLQEIREMGWIKGVKSRKNSGSVGNTLETLLGIQENNLPLPNAAEWELKTQRMETSSLLTLFHMKASITSQSHYDSDRKARKSVILAFRFFMDVFW